MEVGYMNVRTILLSVAVSIGVGFTGPAIAQKNPSPEEALEKLNRMRALQERSMSRTFLPKGSGQTGGVRGTGQASVVQSQPTVPAKSFQKSASQVPVAQKSNVAYRKYSPKNQLNYLINFDFDSAYLSQDSRTVLDEFCQRVLVPDLKKHPAASYIIAGHTDTSGPADYNNSLSERRAKATKAYLADNCSVPNVRLGERLDAVGLGEQRPLPGIASSRQRRVEIQVNI
jgi:outer membrane protein OmpA-like peptidoglycan-associated protein